LDSVAKMVEQGFKDLKEKGLQRKDIARRCLHSVDSFYKIVNAGRSIPSQSRLDLAKLHPLFGRAIALEGTGYGIFERPDCDMHIQSVMQHVFKEHQEADAAIKPLPRILLDKQKPEDLSPEVTEIIKSAVKEICDDVQWKLEFLTDLETQYKLGIVDSCLLTKAKAACADTQTTLNR